MYVHGRLRGLLGLMNFTKRLPRQANIMLTPDVDQYFCYCFIFNTVKCHLAYTFLKYNMKHVKVYMY